MVVRNRLIDNYFNDKVINLRLFDIDAKEVIDMKCNEILKFKHNGTKTRIKRFYDELACFDLRSFLFRYMT